MRRLPGALALGSADAVGTSGTLLVTGNRTAASGSLSVLSGGITTLRRRRR